jgi:hypothetical protein
MSRWIIAEFCIPLRWIFSLHSATNKIEKVELEFVMSNCRKTRAASTGLERALLKHRYAGSVSAPFVPN